MARLTFECDTKGCGNAIHQDVPIGSDFVETRCTNCGAPFHARAVVVRVDTDPGEGIEFGEETEAQPEGLEEPDGGDESESPDEEPGSVSEQV